MSPTEGTPIPGFLRVATSGHAAAVLPTNAINSRRLMVSPAPRTTSGIKSISHFGSRIVPFVPPKRAALRHSTNPRRQIQTLRSGARAHQWRDDKFAVQRRPLIQPFLLTIIKLLKVVALLSWGRFSYARARPQFSVPHPPKMLDEVGADIFIASGLMTYSPGGL